MILTRLAAVLALALSLCLPALAQEASPPFPAAQPAAPPPETGRDVSDERAVFDVTGLYIFAMKPRANVDPYGGSRESVLAGASVDTGNGWGARLGGGWESGGWIRLRPTIGLLYMQTENFERTERTYVRTHAAYVEPMLEAAAGPRDVTLHAGIGLGFGGTCFHFSHSFDDENEGAFEVRLLISLTVLDHLDAGITGGYFVWGYPGRTLGDGGFGALTFTLRF